MTVFIEIGASRLADGPLGCLLESGPKHLFCPFLLTRSRVPTIKYFLNGTFRYGCLIFALEGLLFGCHVPPGELLMIDAFQRGHKREGGAGCRSCIPASTLSPPGYATFSPAEMVCPVARALSTTTTLQEALYNETRLIASRGVLDRSHDRFRPA